MSKIDELVSESFSYYKSVSKAEQVKLLQSLKDKIAAHENGLKHIGFGLDESKIEAAKIFIEKVKEDELYENNQK